MSETHDNSGLHFMKMHGLGNDFVVIDSRGQSAVMTRPLARLIGDRHRGVGFDQLAEITLDADTPRLTFWNSDGSQAGACGNATRCIADFLMKEAHSNSIALISERGTLQASRHANGFASVNMGHPQTNWDEVPLAKQVDPTDLPIEGTPFAVGMGNPHCVFFVEDAEQVEPSDLGPQIEHHALFPEGTNVEFVSQRPDGSLRMRVWERGAGITLACGSGACATAFAAHTRNLTGPEVTVHMDGGAVQIDCRDDGIWMTGPTAHIFDGTLSPAFLALAT